MNNTQQDTHAAANKAAEEGGLPEISNQVLAAAQDEANRQGWSVLEMDFAAILRAAFAADRASRQVAAQAGQVAVPEFDIYMRSRVADLLHLLQFATISTPSHGDSDQAKLVMADLRRNLAKSAPSPAKESK